MKEQGTLEDMVRDMMIEASGKVMAGDTAVRVDEATKVAMSLVSGAIEDTTDTVVVEKMTNAQRAQMVCTMLQGMLHRGLAKQPGTMLELDEEFCRRMSRLALLHVNFVEELVMDRRIDQRGSQ